MKIRGIAVILIVSLVAINWPSARADDSWPTSAGTRPTDRWFGNSSTPGDGWFGPRSTSAASPAKKSSTNTWFPWTDDKPKKAKTSKRKEPSMMEKVTDGTKNTWNKTVSFLNPFDNKPAPKPPVKEDVFKPASVNDFLKGEMPR